MLKVVLAFLIGLDVQGLVVQMADMAHYLQRHCMLEVAAAFVLGSDMQGLLVQMADTACYPQKHCMLAAACSIGSDVPRLAGADNGHCPPFCKAASAPAAYPGRYLSEQRTRH